MKTLTELESLRSQLVDNFYVECQRLAGWNTDDIAKINAKAYKEEDWAWNDEWRILKANSALISTLASTISALDKMIKERQVKAPKKDIASEALEKLRNE